MGLVRYQFVARESEIEEIIDNRIVNLKVVNIGVKDLKSGIVYPHPLTSFIRVMYEYKGTSLNTQLSPANIVCRFLNYIYLMIDQRDTEFMPLIHTGIKGLQLKHGSRFITSLTMRGLKKETVKYYENYLKTFYYYLQEHKIITPEFQIKKYWGPKGRIIIDSPFRSPSQEARFPSKQTQKSKQDQLKDFGANRYQLIIDFIQKTREVAPEIALGVCLQFYGGIRRGEIVNLTPSSLKVVLGDSFTVEIRDNRRILFAHLKDTTKEYPKRLNYLQTHLANQTILDNDLVWEVYTQHMNTLQLKLKRKEVQNTSALFLDADGKAMSGNVYERKFKKVKKQFLDELKNAEGRMADYTLLSENTWGTHIGRGIFTNFLFDMGLSITQIAIARGDTNIDSAMAYVDTKSTLSALNDAINQLNNLPAVQFGLIDHKTVSTRWKRGVTHNSE